MLSKPSNKAAKPSASATPGRVIAERSFETRCRSILDGVVAKLTDAAKEVDAVHAKKHEDLQKELDLQHRSAAVARERAEAKNKEFLADLTREHARRTDTRRAAFERMEEEMAASKAKQAQELKETYAKELECAQEKWRASKAKEIDAIKLRHRQDTILLKAECLQDAEAALKAKHEQELVCLKGVKRDDFETAVQERYRFYISQAEKKTRDANARADNLEHVVLPPLRAELTSHAAALVRLEADNDTHRQTCLRLQAELDYERGVKVNAMHTVAEQARIIDGLRAAQGCSSYRVYQP